MKNGWLIGREILRSTVGASTEPSGLVGGKANAGECENVEDRPRRRMELRSPSSRHLYW